MEQINKLKSWVSGLSKKDQITYGVIAVLLISVIYFATQNSATPTNDDASKNTVTATSTKTTKSVSSVAKNVMNKCNFRVTSPAMYSYVNIPFTVKGILDKADTTKGCMWSDIQTLAGSAEIFYNKNNAGWVSAGTSVAINTSGVPGAATTTLGFSIPFNLYVQALGLKSGTPIKIVFTEFNIPVRANPDTFDFIVYLK